MKILHTADWHLGAYVGPQCDDPYKRMENTMRCLEKLVDTVRKEQPDIILICGDIFHQAKVWADRALTEVRVAADYINRLSQFAPIAILYGTPNHDGISQYETLEQMTPGITYFTGPGIRTLLTNSGPIQVAGLPGFDKGHFRAQFPGLSAEEENQVFSQQLDTIIQGLSAQVEPSIPSVLMAHHTVIGCEIDNGQHVFQANEVILNSTILENSNFDLVCLGHIHKAQIVGDIFKKLIFYSGSLDAFTFNDEGSTKGFWIHEIGDKPNHRIIETPAREFKTLKWGQSAVKIYNDGQVDIFDTYKLKDKVVRILYTCDSETEKALDKKKLERDLYDAGAYYVSEICPDGIHEVVNKERLHEKLTISDCLERYLIEKGMKELDISQLLSEAVDIIAEVSANSPTGGQTGLFLPIEIEVRNYRSYTEEKLSFKDIYFAMVNGRNGSGKSSLFMDALVDCLYEEPREGELTGWIRNGEKSGSIKFIFQLGDDIWRVTRTRQRNGKGTLALALHEPDAEPINSIGFSDYAWGDHSCERMADTQQKIIDLLGMDADTFRSCVLIMQDQYGVFMEAKPEERMNVLANLLGLGIYEQLEEETKKTLAEVNRGLRNAKDEVLSLEQDVMQINGLQSMLDAKQKELKTVEATLKLLKQRKDETAAKVATLNQVQNEKTRLHQEIANKENILKNKNRKLDELINNAAQTRAFLNMEEDLNKKHDEFLEAKQQLAIMDSKTKVLKDKQFQIDKLSKELSKLNVEKNKLERDIRVIEGKLQETNRLQEFLEQLNGIEDILACWEEKEKKNREIDQLIHPVNIELAKINHQIEVFKKQTAILENANCIDIENAQCGFLKAAKEAKNKLEDLSLKKLKLQETILRLENERSILGYDFYQHQKAKESYQDYVNIKQELASLEGDKKLLEVHNNRYAEVLNSISVNNEEKRLIETELYTLQQELSGYNDLKTRIETLEQSEQQWQQLPAAKKYLETIIPQINEIAKEIEQLQAEIQHDKDKSTELSIQVQDLQRYQDGLQSLNRSISDYEATASSYNRTIGSLEEKLAFLMQKKDTLDKAKKSVNELAERSARLQILSEAFSQDGIPHQIIRDIIPELEASANEILSKMTGGRMRLKFRTEKTLKSNKSKEVATLDIVIIDVENGELPYLSRSGGQKVRAALAVSFALAMIKASRVGLQLGMMFVDEPPFLDTEGVEAYCMALQSIHEKYPEMRIIAISHDENMKARFPQQLTIVETENGSKVRLG